jgi:dGTPase
MTDSPGTIRGSYQRHQDGWLSPAAVRERQSGGRAFNEPEHPYRTCFQRDRDRIVHTSAFRRLDYKTQVFVPHEHDMFRTRLTHTVEVAQVARSLARAMRLNEDLAEAVALAHDLGHPPFGHGGESELDALMADHGGFEHNRQSLRVVDYLEHPYPDFRGLNLTRAVRECLAKHETRYDTPSSDEFDPSQRAPLEGQLVDQADTIAYTAADLEDALMARWIQPADLETLQLWQRAMSLARASWPDARPIPLQNRAVKTVLALLADDLVTNSLAAIEAAAIGDPDAVRRHPTRLVGLSEPMAAALDETSAFLMSNVYLHRDNTAKDRESRRVLRELFEALVARPAMLPDRYARRIDRDGLQRTVCDYVAGMTDRYCHREYARVVGS